MPWEVARRALDLVLGTAAGEARIALSGGEPLLEPELVRRCVLHVRDHPRGGTAELLLSTNGTLLPPELVRFLMANDVELDLSFDGVAEAQAARGAWTFPVLTGLLDDLVSAHPGYARRKVHLGLTLSSANVGFLAASVDLLMCQGIARIHVTPSITADNGWGPDSEVDLEEQVAHIVQRSLEHWEETGTVPVGFLAGGKRRSEATALGLPCNAGTGELLCVDPGGRLWTCPALASSLRRPPALVRDALRVLDLGNGVDADLPDRLRRLPDRARGLPLFIMPEERGSPKGSCRSCEEVGVCHVCPAALEAPAQPGDPPAVPDLHCAFNRITAEARRRFLKRRRQEALSIRLERLIRKTDR